MAQKHVPHTVEDAMIFSKTRLRLIKRMYTPNDWKSERNAFKFAHAFEMWLVHLIHTDREDFRIIKTHMICRLAYKYGLSRTAHLYGKFTK